MCFCVTALDSSGAYCAAYAEPVATVGNRGRGTMSRQTHTRECGLVVALKVTSA